MDAKTSGLVAKREFKKLDRDHLIEEIESLGKSQLDILENHLCTLLLHLLKGKYQPSMHTRSWDLSIRNARYHVEKLLRKNPSFKTKLSEISTDAYFTGRLKAIDQTGLDESVFPEECPWKIEELLSEKDERKGTKGQRPKGPKRPKGRKDRDKRTRTNRTNRT